MFLQYSSARERRSQDGSDFIELQRCQSTAPEKTLVAVESILHWQETSLYIPGDLANAFYGVYGELLGPGLYSNLQEGPLDQCGINYYSREKMSAIAQRLKESKPERYERLLSWLQEDPDANGFYILGI